MNDAELLSEIASLPASEGYTGRERYHDFRTVFYGSPEGQRVFREILGWGHLLAPSVVGSPIDPYLTHIREGESNVARRILATTLQEPKDKPPKQRGKT